MVAPSGAQRKRPASPARRRKNLVKYGHMRSASLVDTIHRCVRPVVALFAEAAASAIRHRRLRALCSYSTGIDFSLRESRS
jgi:hypothetical protein